MRSYLSAILLFLLFCCTFDLRGQIFGDIFETADDSLMRGSKQAGLFVLPLIYYSPDTRFGAGALGVYYFHLKNEHADQKDSTRLSYVKLLADYTQNRQTDVWSSWNIFLKDEAYLFKGEFRFRNFPDRYYGVGNTTSGDQMERYEYNLLSFKFLALKKIMPQMFAGLDIQVVQEYGLQREPDGELDQGNITGYDGGLGIGAGGVFTWDARDNVVNASRGFLLEVATYIDHPFLGSDFKFNNYNITYNRYFKVAERQVFATNLVGNFNTGDVPFLDMARVGGEEILRGYARNRYRDKNFIGGQVEYRFPLVWRFGGVAFAGLGDVFDRPSEVTMSTLKYSFGGGLRFLVSKREGINVRFDYGFGRDSQAFYISLTEAF